MQENILVPFFVFFTIGWIAWVVFSTIRRHQVAKFQAGVQMKLLEKIDSSQHLLSYVETDAGRQFLNSLAVEQTEQATPYKSILSGVRAGIMLIAFGVALLSLHSLVGHEAQANTFFGTLAIALGIGFELAAAATYFLSRSFGLLNRGERA
jgi:fucose 4-O-acetylase-like acetyltransferase